MAYRLMDSDKKKKGTPPASQPRPYFFEGFLATFFQAPAFDRCPFFSGAAAFFAAAFL